MNGQARPTPRRLLAVICFVSAAWSAERQAQASTAMSIYAAVSRVEMLPAQATATEVVIHGAFMFLDGDGGYSDAVCGYMYFRCPSGSESLCRMQWLDVQSMGTVAGQCAGFGSQNAISSAHVRPEGAQLASPDAWDLGIGVQSGFHIGGKCAPAKQLACAMPASLDGGTVDAPMTVDGPPIIDSRAPDATAPSEGGVRDLVVYEAGTAMDSDTSSGRDLAALDLSPRDGIDQRDAPPADMQTADVPVSAPDAGTDSSAATAGDAVTVNKDASDSSASSDSDGCGCRLGGSGRGRGAVPIELALLVTVVGLAAIRRVR